MKHTIFIRGNSLWKRVPMFNAREICLYEKEEVKSGVFFDFMYWMNQKIFFSIPRWKWFVFTLLLSYIALFI